MQIGTPSGEKKWHIGRFDGQQKTLPKQRNMPVAPYSFEGSPLVHYYTRLNDLLVPKLLLGNGFFEAPAS